MTIDNTERTISYTTTGVSLGPFSVPFNFFEIDVYLDDELVAPSEYTITQTVTGSTGSITFDLNMPDGELRIDGATALTQQTDYTENSAFPADSHEKALDRLTMIAQELKASIASAVLGDFDGLSASAVREAIDVYSTAEVDARLDSIVYRYTDGDNLQTILNTAAGGTLYIPPGTTITQATGVVMPEDTKIIGYGAVLNVTAHVTGLDASAEGCIVEGLQVTGPGDIETYIDGSVGILVSGSYNAAAVAPTYTSGQKLKDVKVNGFASYGILGECWQNGELIAPEVYDCNLAGVALISCKKIRGYGYGYLHDIDFGTAGNTYGFTATRRVNLGVVDTSADFVRCPRTEDVVIQDWLAENIVLWTGFDAHAPYNVRFVNCMSVNAPIAYSLGGDNNGGQCEDSWMINCSARIDLDSEAYDVNDMVYITGDNATHPALNSGVIGGVFTNGGFHSDVNGCFLIKCTLGCKVLGVTIQEPVPHGISCYVDNVGLTLDSITVIDPVSNNAGITTPQAVRVGSALTYPQSVIIGTLTAISTGSPTADHLVASYGVIRNADATNEVSVGNVRDIGTWTIKYIGEITSGLDGTEGAPSDAQYLVGTADGTLSAERVVTDTESITWDLATAATAKVNINPQYAAIFAQVYG